MRQSDQVSQSRSKIPNVSSTPPLGDWVLHEGDAMDAYESWPTPATIISDGAYGVGGFLGDPREAHELPAWYEEHIKAWSASAGPATTLWFWNTEVGWASVHPLLVANGWQYEFTIIWDKGIKHVAGNTNGKTLRSFPVVTEVCAYYTRTPSIETPVGSGQKVHMKKWLLDEWVRSGLPRRAANEACGVKDAATRKYFDQGWLWYMPPPEMMARLVEYANERGKPEGRPYYSLDGTKPVTAAEWARMRNVWNVEYGLSNVWEHPALRGKERYKGSMQRSAPRTYKPTAQSSTHLNQKPLVFMRRMVSACTNPGDVVWEPFGGLCSASVAAIELGRNSYAAEPVPTFADLSRERLSETQAIAPLVSIQSVRSSSGSPAKTQEELDFADEA